MGTKEVLNHLKYLEMHLTNHCNLNCEGCCHFSPLAKEFYLLPEDFEKQIKRLAILINGKLKRLILMGGEPLLNNNINEILLIAKKYLPDTDIQVLTNGILLPHMNAEFWKICQVNDIQIDITEYPINVDYDRIIKFIESKNIKYFLYDEGKKETKKFQRYKFDKLMNQNAEDNFYNRCVMAQSCAYMEDGKIYPCQLASNIKIINEFYEEKFEQSCDDYIDIFDEQIKEEDIYRFLSKPIPFCKYCDFNNPESFKWNRSKKKKLEWGI